ARKFESHCRRRSFRNWTGVNFLNWPGGSEGPNDDPIGIAISQLASRRDSVVICVQFAARTAADAACELRSLLATLRTDYIDVLTLYYVERPEEWEELQSPGGALGYLRDAKREGTLRRIGVTSHQRPFAAQMCRSGLLDVLMIRYNAAHRGAESDIFPVTEDMK